MQDLGQLALPPILKSYSEQLKSLMEQQPGPSRAQGLQRLYVDMIRTALSSGKQGASCVLVIDDLQYADPSSLWVLQEIRAAPA